MYNVYYKLFFNIIISLVDAMSLPNVIEYRDRLLNHFDRKLKQTDKQILYR